MKKGIDYNSILKLVKEGLTIQEACTVSGTNRTTLYRKLTEQQKLELKGYKSINKKV
jgi:transcriptional regulator of acetoin/glycerol metabolism